LRNVVAVVVGQAHHGSELALRGELLLYDFVLCEQLLFLLPRQGSHFGIGAIDQNGIQHGRPPIVVILKMQQVCTIRAA